ncbi:MAG: hypothetical protein NVS2B14_07450 [Chamaesiphon sp.]
MIDYVLTVTVSIASGVANFLSIPRFQGWQPFTVEICLVFIFLIMLANLRGIREASRVFMMLLFHVTGGKIFYTIKQPSS